MVDALPGAEAGKERTTEVIHSDRSLILRVRTDYLQYEREQELAELQEKQQQERIRRHRRRVRWGVLLAVLVLVAGAGIALAILISEALKSNEVAVEEFHMPVELAARGIDGAVVARGVFDELVRLQHATRGMAARRGVRSAWANGVQLAKPPAQLSVDALMLALRAHYGQDLRIGGDVMPAGGGEVLLRVRAEGLASHDFQGPATQLASLYKRAAEFVFSQSQPGLWASELAAEGRYAEALQYARTAFPAAAATEKPYLLNAWGVALEPTGGSAREALALYRQALKLKPDYWNAWTNVQSGCINLGDEEGAWQAGTQMLKIAGGRPGRAPEQDYQSWDLLTWNLQALLDSRIADVEAYGGVGSMISAAGTSLADIHARLHDLEAAENALQTSKEHSNDPAVAAMTHFVRARLATEAGDTARAVSEMAAFAATPGNPAIAADVASNGCWIAPAEEAAGHPDKADAILASAGTFVDCYRFRADILDGRGDWRGAQKAYAAAVRLAPGLPAAYYSWGLALARRGDLEGSVEKLKQANARGPHWADPLKAWGDVLSKKGQLKEASAKYREALKYAPSWAELNKAASDSQRIN